MSPHLPAVLSFDPDGTLVTVAFSEIEVGEICFLVTGDPVAEEGAEPSFSVGLSPLSKLDEEHASTYLLSEAIEVAPEARVVRYISSHT